MCKGDLPALRKLLELLVVDITNAFYAHSSSTTIAGCSTGRSVKGFLQVQNTIWTKLKPQSTILPEEPKVKNLLFILECNGNDSQKNYELEQPRFLKTDDQHLNYEALEVTEANGRYYRYIQFNFGELKV